MEANDHQEELNLGLPADGVAAETNGRPCEGLSWTWDIDVEALLTALADPAPWTRDSARSGADDLPLRPSASPSAGDLPVRRAASPTAGQLPVPPAADSGAADSEPALDQADAEFAEYLEAVETGSYQTVPLPVLAGRVAETVPAGPGLAGWLGSAEVGGLEDWALAGMAASYRRLASWAQAGELAVVAELASRSAAADDRAGIHEDGRPVKIPADACAEVSLALTMSQTAASWWADLAVTLRWRLSATGAALAAGDIDLARARAIADATACLDDDTAQSVQDKVLPKAGIQTTAQLRAALRRAVIAADPAGADRRREEAEKQAKVMLFPDDDGTATLAGYNLPGIHATAAMARITALAAALKASGAGGGIDRLRAHVLLGLLLGTLPYIPPPGDAPPDQPPPDDEPEDGDPPGDNPPGEDLPGEDLPGEDPSRGGTARDRTATDWPGRDDHRGSHRVRHDEPGRPGKPDPDGAHTRGGNGPNDNGESSDDDGAWPRPPPPPWPEMPAFLKRGPAAMNHLTPATGAGGLLDLQLPWATLTGESPQPGYLGRLGPITPAEARRLADLAATDPATRWRITLTDPGGRAIATIGLGRAGTRRHAGLIKQVTVTVGLDHLDDADPGNLPPAMHRILATARHLADHAARQAERNAQTDDQCAHDNATASYQPTTRLRDYITARDQTCRFPTCRQPAWRCDADHTKPFDQGGRTCSCNLGGLCRFHHQVKGRARWHLDQATPGTFTWTTPNGRQYTTGPDSHAA